jgi:ubiquinone/menaquinone biosynthesis C-methylase UbiE
MDKNYYLQAAEQFEWGPGKENLKPYRIKLLQKHLKGNTILDIGCGSGAWTNYLAEQGFNSTGVDFVEQFIKQAKEIYKGSFIVSNAEKLPFDKNQFDTVFLVSILEHLKDDLTALKEAARVGKRIIFVVPHQTPDQWLKNGLIFKHNLDKSHQRTYSIKEIKKLARKADLELITIDKIERLPAVNILPLLFHAPELVKKIIQKLFFTLFKEKNYYLELLVVCE